MKVQESSARLSICAACGEPVSFTDAGGCVGTDPAYHFKAECLLEAARTEHAEAEALAEALERIASQQPETRRGVLWVHWRNMASDALAEYRSRHPKETP